MSAPTERSLFAVTPRSVWSLAQGVELLGEFEGAAYSERPWLLRRRDGQIIQISRLLYAIASYLDGKAASEDIAEGRERPDWALLERGQRRVSHFSQTGSTRGHW